MKKYDFVNPHNTLLGTITGLEKFIYKEQIYKQSQKSHVGWLQQTVGSNSIQWSQSILNICGLNHKASILV